MIHYHELHDSPFNHSQTQPLYYWPKLTSGNVTKLKKRLHFKFVLRKKSKEVPSADKPKKDQGSHSQVPLLEPPPIYVWHCQGLLKKRQKSTMWRSRDAQKQNNWRDSQPKLTKFSSNHSSSSCLLASSPKIQDILQQNTNADRGLRADWRRTPLGHWGHNKYFIHLLVITIYRVIE
jgi:hypothetical protein